MDTSKIAELISEIDEFISVSKFLGDEKVDKALGLIVNAFHKPDVPPQVVANALVELQSVATICRIKAAKYRYIDKAKSGSTEYEKKNMYYALVDAIENLVAALKYIVRT